MFKFEVNLTSFEHVQLVPVVWRPFRLSWEVYLHFCSFNWWAKWLISRYEFIQVLAEG